MENKRKKIVIGLSGGVDSSVSSYLIKKNSNSEILSIFMQNWENFFFGKKKLSLKCTQKKDWEDAYSVSKFLGIEIKRINFIKEYWENVFLKFLSDLKVGLTPNPDIVCNSSIKFFHFLKYSFNELSADYIATGHYAKVIFNKNNKSYYLAKSFDNEKDQTYFLCNIEFSILPRLIFPLANIKKEKVRKIAKSIGLSNFNKKDSTGICFIGENNFRNFISNYLEKKKGEIINIEDFKIVGEHSGFYFFTIGQRKGLGISNGKIPYYVVGKDIKKNLIYIASRNSSWIYNNWCVVKSVNWLLNEWEIEHVPKRNITAKFRHRQKEVIVKIEFISNLKELKVFFSTPIKAITPGQYAVFYDGIICLGGGLIFSTDKIDNFSNPIKEIAKKNN